MQSKLAAPLVRPWSRGSNEHCTAEVTRIMMIPLMTMIKVQLRILRAGFVTLSLIAIATRALCSDCVSVVNRLRSLEEWAKYLNSSSRKLIKQLSNYKSSSKILVGLLRYLVRFVGRPKLRGFFLISRALAHYNDYGGPSLVPDKSQRHCRNP